MTNNSKGKYWDLIYQTDVNGTVHSALVGKDSLPETSLFFDDKQVVDYHIYDTNRVIDKNKISGDLVYCNVYMLRHDSINICGHDYLIKRISRDSLVLVGTNNKKFTRIFRGFNSGSRIILDSLPNTMRNK